MKRARFAGGCNIPGLSGASSSVEESSASAMAVDPLPLDKLELLNHLVIPDGRKPVTRDVTFFTND